MSGGQDDASNAIDSSGGEWRPKVGDRVRVICDYGPYARKSDVGVVETIREDRCLVQLGHHHGRWWIEYPSLEPQPQEDKKDTNDMSEGLDLSKPCEVCLAGNKWECVIGAPVFNGKAHDPRYGCYLNVDDGDESLVHFWIHRAQIRNVREPQYEHSRKQTMKNSTTKYPIGPETQKLAAQTQAGKLAKLLNRILYYSDTRPLPVLGSPTTLSPNSYLVSNALTFVNKDPLPEGLQAVNSHVETEEALRAIRDFLEFKSLEEVIP